MGDTTVRALDGVNLTIAAGEFVAITGPSGSGKSTMMHLLGCLDRPTHGEYVLDGRNVARLNDRELADVRNRKIGFVFQTFNLINRTSALENVAVPQFYARRLNTRQPARKALERVGLGHRMHHRPSELSGGERQRVAIARAIVNDPVLVLADEPTGNLDSRTGEQIMEVFHSLNRQGVTIILVTHEHDVAIQARRIVQMRDGKIIADRSTEEVLRDSGPSGLPNDGKQKGGIDKILTAGSSSQPRMNEEGLPYPAPAGNAAAPGIGVAVEQVSVNNGALSVSVAEETPLAQGANFGMICGIAAPLLAGLGYALGRLAPRDQFREGVQPSQEAMMLAFGAMGSFLIALVAAIIAIVVSRGALRRMREAPIELSGKLRARTGLWLGWLVVLLPVFSIAWQIAKKTLKS
ncbi:MAG: ABC transporter ATP-binding protein [Phycisphaerales bacterium]|nr:ABC transporter ATP-binding protein [Phycisphaerales bacterium]